MATLLYDQFGGIAPRIHPTLLGQNMAVRAHNCWLKSGKLVPIRQPKVVEDVEIHLENGLSDIATAKTIYVWHRSDGKVMILAWPGIVYVSESNLSNDNASRLFVSGETDIGSGNDPCVYQAKPSGDGISRSSIVKESLPPPVASNYTKDEGGTIDTANVRYTFFFQTWVDQYGYESGVSNPSDEIEYNNGNVISIGQCDAPQGARSRRIYKVVSGTESESVQFVFEQYITIGNTTFSEFKFKILDEDAGEVLPILQSASSDLSMITKVPNGFYAGVRRSNIREVRFSETGNPTIWPDSYTASIHDDIVGLGVTLNTVFVLTKGNPWAVTGTAPDAMTSAILASAQGCVSAQSICTWDGRVFYASDDGICMLMDGSATVSLLTDKIFSRREWQNLNPSSCRMVAHDSALFAWFDNLAITIQLNDDSTVSVTTHDEPAGAVCVDVEEDKLFFIRNAEVEVESEE